ncbi:selenoprotein P [Platysternon megacephalum]|uniref:Selenoprotein P n=1 Tax=Platysternon megacephalum TaxID=55544 RepID=A0A4D9ELB2_9SAUR|nr:selenoprotein P [Platysternon megacephalum]
MGLTSHVHLQPLHMLPPPPDGVRPHIQVNSSWGECLSQVRCLDLGREPWNSCQGMGSQPLELQGCLEALLIRAQQVGACGPDAALPSHLPPGRALPAEL